MASPRSINNSHINRTRRQSNQNLAESPFRQTSRLGTSPLAGGGSPSLRSFSISGNGNGNGNGNGISSQSHPFAVSTSNSRRTSFDSTIPDSHRPSHSFANSEHPFHHALGTSPQSSLLQGSSAVPIQSATPSIYSLNIENPDPEIVRVVGRHLVTDEDISSSYKNSHSNFGTMNGHDGASNFQNSGAGPSTSNSNYNNGNNSSASGSTPLVGPDEQFDSLKLQGGDITRQLYKWQKDHEPDSIRTRNRSKSFDMPRPVDPDTQNIKVPGGFRRNFISQRAQESHQAGPPTFLTRNFIEFLSIYGHFAGEELEDEDEEDYDEDEETEEEYRSRQRAAGAGAGGSGDGGEDGEQPTEETALLPSREHRKHRGAQTQGNATATKAVLLLLKSFVGTGVLFLPKAFLNGGILFSSLALVFVALLSQLCFVLLIQSRKAVGVSSFGDIGGALYGSHMRQLILSSIVLSQIGFAAAYIVFTSENLQALILAVTNNKTLVNIEDLIFLQLIIFLPLSMIRNLAKLSGTALIADFFILLGLLYLYYWGGLTLARNGVSDIKLFNSHDWTLFIGTAIFTFEGIGLIIPIQESMKKPAQFTYVLGGVMIGITVIFVSMGALSYAAYGSDVKTVVILNLPQDSKFVNCVQLFYSLAILLSTPLQLFPAIRILENGLFIRSGKYNVKIKWQKNVFRFCLVFFTAFIAWGGADDLDRFVALIGSFACIPLGYIYPPLLHLKGVAKTTSAKVFDLILIIFGFTCMIYTTYCTVISWIASP